MDMKQLVKEKYIAPIEGLSKAKVAAKVDIEDQRRYVTMTNIHIVGFTAREIVIEGVCEFGKFYDSLNPLMICLLLRPEHKDHSITQYRLWSESPTVFKGERV